MNMVTKTGKTQKKPVSKPRRKTSQTGYNDSQLEKVFRERFLPEVKATINETVHQRIQSKYPAEEQFEVLRRMDRNEIELKNQRELIQQGFAMMDKRFESMQHNMDKRFDQVDKRFEQVDKRFDQIDKRFIFMQWVIGVGFSTIVVLMSLYRYFLI